MYTVSYLTSPTGWVLRRGNHTWNSIYIVQCTLWWYTQLSICSLSMWSHYMMSSTIIKKKQYSQKLPIYIILFMQNSFNTLPHMPILGFPIQQQIKIWCQIYEQMGIWLPDWVENNCGKRRNCWLRAIYSFPTMFSKAVCCWCVEMSIYGVKG